MKILVTYFTQTNNTEKIARAIFDEVGKTHEADLARIDEIAPDQAGRYDLVFVGSPCHAGDLSAATRSFLMGLPQQGAFDLAGFITHSSSAYEKEGFAKCISTFETISTEKGIKLLGCFDCQGYLSADLQPYVKKARKASDDEWNKIVEKMTGHPDGEDEKKARAFALEAVGKV
jgi:flavodoxin